MNTMSEPNGESKKVGRPTVYSGPEGPVYEAFETHLNKIAGNCKRRRSCDRRLFADIGDLKSPKYDKMKVHLKFLLELAKVDPHWNFGGPFQVALLIKWNKGWNNGAGFHARRHSRQWARGEIANLWKMERSLDALAEDPEGWAGVVEDVKEYPIPQRRSQQLQLPPAELVFDDDDVPSSPPLQSVPSWFLDDFADMMPEEADELSEPSEDTTAATGSNSIPPETRGAQELDLKREAKQPWTPDVMLENGLPWMFDQSGHKMFGTFSDAPSKDGMAMVCFPGVELPVEMTSLLFEDIGKFRPMKRPAGVLKKPASSKKIKTNDTTGDGEDADGDRVENNDEGCGEDGEIIEEDSMEDVEGEEEEEEEEEAEEEEEEMEAEAEEEGGGAGAENQDDAADGDAGQNAKFLRPLQHWLRTRPEGQQTADRHNEWRSKSKEFKKQYAIDTYAQRSEGRA